GHGLGVLVGAHQHDRLDEGALHRLGAAEHGLGAVGQRALDMALDDVDLARHGHRAVGGALLRAGLDVGEDALDLGDQLVGDRLVHVDALHARAGLAAVGGGAPRDRVGGGLHVGVGVDDDRVLATALEQHGGQVLGGGGHDALAGGGGTGEGDLVDAGLHQRRTGRAAAGDGLEHALGQLGVGLLEI